MTKPLQPERAMRAALEALRIDDGKVRRADTAQEILVRALGGTLTGGMPTGRRYTVPGPDPNGYPTHGEIR